MFSVLYLNKILWERKLNPIRVGRFMHDCGLNHRVKKKSYLMTSLQNCRCPQNKISFEYPRIIYATLEPHI